MFIAIEPDHYETYGHLIAQMHRTRKAVFHDRLGWEVQVKGDFEIDQYDLASSVYIIWCDDSLTTFLGCMRLLPTTGPTLLEDFFRRTYPSDMDLSAPSIWEGTRTCVDERALSAHHPSIAPATAFGLIMLAVCEWALTHKVETIVTNYEPRLARVYRRAGVEIDEIGRADGFGRFPVCCGLVEISADLLRKMRLALRVEGALLRLDGTSPVEELAA